MDEREEKASGCVHRRDRKKNSTNVSYLDEVYLAIDGECESG